ncbi:ribbon-helix-helix protein, CopG family [Brucella sp. BTU2]|uniref:Ribbon-helix-helix protein, CopG family n=1 Tax=Brucella haematophila TaxID=419474 RepID=A0ABX1DT23_9HYPH|nr:ribbon-helix-helix protein, CopG family [Ochrobactrum sp. BTU2]NKC05365.1 ribbon-helix-helix protein, CopG family [Brucella haematophila]
MRELRKSRERESKHFVNVSLDYETKRRLEKAAHDNGLKMTVILRDAIDQYLKDNGY